MSGVLQRGRIEKQMQNGKGKGKKKSLIFESSRHGCNSLQHENMVGYDVLIELEPLIIN